MTGIVVAFFAAMMVLPLTTVGDPAFDIPMLRARWYMAFLVFVPHLGAVGLTLVLAIRHRSPWAALACGLLGASVYAIVTEQDRFIRYGLLIDAYDVSMRRLVWARLATLALSAGALLALRRGDVRR